MRKFFHLPKHQKKTFTSFDPLEITADQNRRKVFLRYINRAWLIFGVVTLAGLPIFPEQSKVFIFLIAIIFPTYLTTRFLNLSGRIKLAGVVFTLAVNFGFYGLFMMLVGELGAYKAFETEISVWMLMGLAVLFAGALVDIWAAPALAALNTILLIGTRLTIAPDSDPRPSAVVFWWMMALTIWVYETTLREALKRAHVEALERRQSDESLHAAEQNYRNIFENALEGIGRSTLGGKMLQANPALVHLNGYETETELIAGVNDISREWYVDPNRRAEFMHILQETGQVLNFESEIYRHKTRERIWIRESARLISDSGGNPQWIETVVQDITERKLAESTQLLIEAQMKANLENTPNVSIQWYDHEARVQYWNPASETIYGWKADEAIGKTLDNLIHTPEEAAEFKRLLDDIRETGKPFGPYEAKIKRRNGSSGWVLATTFSIPMANGQIGFVCMDIDITERKIAEQRIQNQLEHLNALHNIDNAISSSFDLHTTLGIFLNEVSDQLKVDAAAILLFNKHTLTLDHAASRGFNSAALQYTKLGFGEGYAGRVIVERKTVHIPDLAKAENKLSRALSTAGERFAAYVGSPLIAKGEIVGVLEIFQRQPLAQDPEWFNFLEILVGQAAIAVDSAQLFENLQRSNFDLTLAYDATIEGWSRALDLRDKETEGHTQRVTALTMQLSKQMKISDSEMAHIRRGALLHDIGKMGIPDNILLKPDQLTNEEWKIMRQHTIYASEMLSPITYLKPALDIPRHHHEKWDGTGYPQGLKGMEIPLPARIFAVVDVWDALTSDRPYRAAWSKEKTVEYIKSETGKHFDPKVAEKFLVLISSGNYFNARYL